MGKSCCFTGHRKARPEYHIRQITTRKIIELIEKRGVEDFYNGGSYGFDFIAGDIVCELKKTYTSVKLHMVLPCCKEDQTRFWYPRSIDDYDKLLSLADSVEYISERYYDGCMRDRNEALVGLASDYCLCYVNPHIYRSGSAQTMRMAKKRGLKIINLFEDPQQVLQTFAF